MASTGISPPPDASATSRASGAAPGPGWFSRHVLAIVASLVVAGSFAWILHAGALPVVPSRADLARVPWWAPVCYAASFAALVVLRAVRWYWLLRPIHPISPKRVLTISLVGFGAGIVLPFRLAELVRPILIHRRGHISGWAAIGTTGAEHVIDGLFLMTMLFVSLQIATPLDPLPDHIGELPVPAAVVPGAAYSAVVFFAVVFVVMGLFYWRRDQARRLTERVLGIVSPHWAKWVADKVDHVAQGMRFLPRLRYMGPFFLATATYWMGNVVILWMLFKAAGITSMTFGQACVVLGVLSLGALVPNAPGFFGSFQIAGYAGLAIFHTADVVMTEGGVGIFWMYTMQIGVVLLGAVVGLLAEGISPKEALEAGEARGVDREA